MRAHNCCYLSNALFTWELLYIDGLIIIQTNKFMNNLSVIIISYWLEWSCWRDWNCCRRGTWWAPWCRKYGSASSRRIREQPPWLWAGCTRGTWESHGAGCDSLGWSWGCSRSRSSRKSKVPIQIRSARPGRGWQLGAVRLRERQLVTGTARLRIPSTYIRANLWKIWRRS